MSYPEEENGLSGRGGLRKLKMEVGEVVTGFLGGQEGSNVLPWGEESRKEDDKVQALLET